MSARHTERLRADPRLPGYLIGGFGAMIAALATGQAVLAAIGAPFLALALLGLIQHRPPRVRGSATLAGSLALEGTDVDGVIRLEWDGAADIDVRLAGLRGVEPVDPQELRWSFTDARDGLAIPFRVRARSWGNHALGEVWIRVRRPDALLMTEQRLPDEPLLRVLPSPVRLDRLLHPHAPRAVAGMHVSRFRGHGTDFAELRPYQPGDRIRDLHWGTSARLDAPWVTVHHSERTGTVVLLLDTVFGTDAASAATLAHSARTAWAVAQAHLRSQDRVGLLAQGRAVSWLPPRAGRRARWQILDELLYLGAAAEDPFHRPRRRSRASIPRDALVVAITPLRSRDFVRTVLHYRRTGLRVGALIIDASEMAPAPRDRADQAARRILKARMDAERDLLEAGGVPAALVAGGTGVGTATASLARRLDRFRTGVRA